MTAAGRTLYYFSFYVFVLGVFVIAAPQVVTGVVGLPAPREPYIRIVGVLLFWIAWYYRVAGRSSLTPLIRASMAARASIPVFLAVFALLGVGPWVLVVFGVVDLAGALWTLAALRREASAAA